MAQTFSVPIGSVGSVVITEDAGVLTVQATVALQQGAVKVGANLSGDIAALLMMAATAQSNALVKAVLTEASVLAKVA